MRRRNLLFTLVVLTGCSSFMYTPSELDPVDWDVIGEEVKVERVHLPTKCAPFYNDGSDRWIECMGVGYK